MSAPYQGLGPTLAECLTAEKIALTAELGQVKEERDEARELLAGWPDARVSKAEAERDTALRHLQAMASDRLDKHAWTVVPGVPVASAAVLCRRWHYSQGGSNTATDVHGLYEVGSPDLRGVAWWLPPTRVAAESVDREWQRVVSLTRLVVDPRCPPNAASFLLGRSLRILKREGRWVAAVTYADESQGHTGAIYRASNWQYVGRTGPYPRWLDRDGKQVAPKATVNRTKAEMEALGHRLEGRYHKHKFVMDLRGSERPAQTSLEFAA